MKPPTSSHSGGSRPDESPLAAGIPGAEAVPALRVLTEVRYSLPEMLAELKTEMAASSFAMEKMDQSEIGKLFKSNKKPRRAKPKK